MKAEVNQMDEQERRAKALEIAVSIIGEKHDTCRAEIEMEYEDETETVGRMKSIEEVPISLLDHYRVLASEIEEYIREAPKG
jgi:hypothetical protein